MSKESKVTECDSCGYETVCESFALPQHLQPREAWSDLSKVAKAYLCEVCAKTPAGFSGEYEKEHSEVLRMIAWGINRLLDEIRKDSKKGRG